MALRVPLPKFARQALHKVAAPAMEPGQEDIGLGDVVHGVTKRLGMKHCRDCAKDKDRMNKTVVFGRPR